MSWLFKTGPKQSKCPSCNVTLTGVDAEELALNAKVHNYKKHPMIYAKNQNYDVVEGPPVNRENFRHHLFTRNKFYGVAVNSRILFISACNRLAQVDFIKKQKAQRKACISTLNLGV